MNFKSVATQHDVFQAEQKSNLISLGCVHFGTLKPTYGITFGSAPAPAFGFLHATTFGSASSCSYFWVPASTFGFLHLFLGSCIYTFGFQHLLLGSYTYFWVPAPTFRFQHLLLGSSTYFWVPAPTFGFLNLLLGRILHKRSSRKSAVGKIVFHNNI